jgi:carboxymethylenebutenolidase
MANEADGDLGRVLDDHLAAEFEAKDPDLTMATMTDDPSLLHVPVMTGARGRDALYTFYRDRFIPSWPDDVGVSQLSRTVASNRVVDEIIMEFDHSQVMHFWLPGIEPTGRRVQLPVVVVAGFRGGKVDYEHVYWDQASLLVQIGLLDATALPVTGNVQSRALEDSHIPLNELINRT